MAQAFGTFDEPHAWLIRGLVEYGWPDLTPVGGRVPPGRHGGIELSRLRDSGGRDGVHLLVPALAAGRHCAEDGVYDFVARLFRKDGQWMVALRCVEANYLQEFPFDPGNPLYMAGYLHQAVLGYVPQFVQWRLQGGELTWAQRKGLPEIAGEACSSALVTFLDEAIRTRRGMDSGPTEGWWLGRPTLPPPAGHNPPGSSGAPAAWAGGAIAVAGRAGGGSASPVEQARKKVAGPARALTAASGALVATGLLSLLNAGLTAVLFQLDRPAAMGGSACFGIVLVGMGALSVLGGRRLGNLDRSPLPWIAVGTNLLMPLLLAGAMLAVDLMCCAAVGPLLLCPPVALWSLSVLLDPKVASVRKELAQGAPR